MDTWLVNPFFPNMEPRLSASWTPASGIRMLSCDLPTAWLDALRRLGSDLGVRQYGGTIIHVDWVVQHDPDGGSAWLHSAVTTAENGTDGLSGNGMGAHIDADEETVLASMADLVQGAVAECRTAWPWGDGGGFMSPVLVDGCAQWRDRAGALTRIGDLGSDTANRRHG